MRIAIIGGEKSLIDGNWDRRLVDHGLEVVAHHHDKNRTKMCVLPVNTEGVIVVRDMARHHLSGAAKVEADKRGIPYAAVPRKWSKAEPLLRMQGILPPENNSTSLPPVAKRLGLGLAYIIQARSEGRIPKQDEVFGAMRRAFGPRCKLDSKEYGKLCNKAAAEQPLGDKPETPDTFDDAYEWATTLLGERPDLLLDTADYHKQVLALIGETDKIKRVTAGADEAIKRLRARWKADSAARLAAQKVWLRGWWLRWRTNPSTVEFPRNREVLTKGRSIFGTTPPNPVMREARAHVLGEWALNLVELGPGQTYLDKKLSTPLRQRAELRTLLESGDIRGFEVVPKAQKRRGRWYTSELAIDAYVATLTAKSEVTVRAPMLDEIAKLLTPITTALTDVQARLKALEDKPPPTVNVDVGVDLVEINERVTAIQEAVNALGKPSEDPVAMGFGEAVDAVISGVSERQVEVAIRPLPVSR